MVKDPREVLTLLVSSKFRDHNEEIKNISYDLMKVSGISFSNLTMDKFIFFEKNEFFYTFRSFVLKNNSIFSTKEGSKFKIKIKDSFTKNILETYEGVFSHPQNIIFKKSTVENNGEPIDIIFYCENEKTNTTDKSGEYEWTNLKKCFNYDLSEKSKLKQYFVLHNRWKTLDIKIAPIKSPLKYHQMKKKYPLKPKNNSILYLSILRKFLNSSESFLIKKILIRFQYKKTLKKINKIKSLLYHHIDTKKPLKVSWSYTINISNSNNFDISLDKNPRIQFHAYEESLEFLRLILSPLDFLIKTIQFIPLTFNYLKEKR